jgi:hypothetical protein
MDRHWYDLGRFRILAKPLPENPAFTTHHIYLGSKLLRQQLSVPSVDDCETAAVAEELKIHSSSVLARAMHHHRKAGTGRPRALTVKRKAY